MSPIPRISRPPAALIIVILTLCHGQMRFYVSSVCSPGLILEQLPLSFLVEDAIVAVQTSNMVGVQSALLSTI